MARRVLKKPLAPIPGAEYVEIRGLGLIPVWGLPVMSEEREKELGRQSAQKWEEAQKGR